MGLGGIATGLDGTVDVELGEVALDVVGEFGLKPVDGRESVPMPVLRMCFRQGGIAAAPIAAATVHCKSAQTVVGVPLWFGSNELWRWRWHVVVIVEATRHERRAHGPAVACHVDRYLGRCVVVRRKLTRL